TFTGGERIGNTTDSKDPYGDQEAWHVMYCLAWASAPRELLQACPLNSDDTVSWIFEGIGKDELIGVKGPGRGVSGDEIDWFDFSIGSPACVKVLASGTGHLDDLRIVPEGVAFPILNTLGI
ncbi:uncharacterized protein N7482_000915, partial [Penicillium canariense]